MASSSSRPDLQAPLDASSLLVVTRSDAALPPNYASSWKSVQKILPIACRKNKGSFRAYAQSDIVLQPWWFAELASNPRAAKDVLWPETELVPGSPSIGNLHWSLRLLRYQVRIDKKTLEVSMFAAMTFFETVFVVLTPYPGSWPGGLDTIANFTGWRSLKITDWFLNRRSDETRRQNNLEDDTQTAVTEVLVITRTGDQASIYLRKAAHDYITRQIPNMIWDEATFEYCLINLLKPLADRQLPKYCTLTLHRSHLHGIYVGPLDHHWSDNPIMQLHTIQTHCLPRSHNVDHLDFPPPITYQIPKDSRFRVFLFNDEGAVDDYLKRWKEGRISSSSKYKDVRVQAYDPEKHD